MGAQGTLPWLGSPWAKGHEMICSTPRKKPTATLAELEFAADRQLLFQVSQSSPPLCHLIARHIFSKPGLSKQLCYSIVVHKGRQQIEQRWLRGALVSRVCRQVSKCKDHVLRAHFRFSFLVIWKTPKLLLIWRLGAAGDTADTKLIGISILAPIQDQVLHCGCFYFLSWQFQVLFFQIPSEPFLVPPCPGNCAGLLEGTKPRERKFAASCNVKPMKRKCMFDLIVVTVHRRKEDWGLKGGKEIREVESNDGKNF